MSVLVIFFALFIALLIWLNRILSKKIEKKNEEIYKLEKALLDKDNVSIEEDYQERILTVKHKDYVRYIPMDNEE